QLDAFRESQIEKLDLGIEERANRLHSQAQHALAQPGRVHRPAVRLALRDAQRGRTGESERQFITTQRFVLPMPVIEAVVVLQKVWVLRSAGRIRLDIVP